MDNCDHDSVSATTAKCFDCGVYVCCWCDTTATHKVLGSADPICLFHVKDQKLGPHEVYSIQTLI